MGGERTNLKAGLVIAVLLGFCAIASGKVIYVDGGRPAGGNGQNWGTAYKYLQDGLTAATSGDEIWVAQGTYKPDQGGGKTPGDRTATFALKNGVAIYGGFPSGGGSRNPNAYKTTLSGDLSGNDIPVAPCDLLDEPTRAENSYSVVRAYDADATAILDGFTITAGNANTWPWPDDIGGGVSNCRSSPTVTNCAFSGNSALEGGGMCNFWGSSPIVTNCTFTGNAAEYSGGGGGGMSNISDSNPTVTNCTFSDNWTNAWGGGMDNDEGSSPTLTNCTFSGNSASPGGGMSNRESSPTLTNCTFSGNSAHDGGGMGNYFESNPTVIGCTFSGNSAKIGGGMENGDNCNPTVTNCTFSGNSGDQRGGGMENWGGDPNIINCTFSGNSADGMYNKGSSPTVTNCTFSGNVGSGMRNVESSSPTVTNCKFSGNSSVYSGGGMWNYQDSNPTVTNCLFNGNWAYYGGGMSNVYSSPTVTNCTFSGNSAEYYGGGMYNAYSSPTLTNCILWGDTAPTGAQIYNDGTSSSPAVSYCDVQGGWAGTGNINANPLFVDADGPDNIFGTADDNLRLQAGSPCIDAGDNTAVPAGHRRPR